MSKFSSGFSLNYIWKLVAMQNDGSDKNENEVGNDVDKNVEKDGKPFVDAKHLKRGAHLKRDHFPASE